MCSKFSSIFSTELRVEINASSLIMRLKNNLVWLNPAVTVCYRAMRLTNCIPEFFFVVNYFDNYNIVYVSYMQQVPL